MSFSIHLISFGLVLAGILVIFTRFTSRFTLRFIEVIFESIGSDDFATMLLGHFLGGQEALKNCQAGEVEDGNEETGDEPGNQKDNESRHERLLDLVTVSGG